MTEVTDKLSTALANRYKIESHLGEGGMANVYLAHDVKHDRKVAVKVLRPELAAVLGAERFVQEIKTTANLQHPHILPLFDSGEADGFLYYVMPFIDGETLRDKLNRETQLGIDEAVGITTAIADALDYAHRNNVIHRDIKPENILLHDGRPMVADFGIALALSAAAGGRMTETGMSLGTPHYMSPEQATAEKDLTNRSDIYSLGCVLYEMLTGEPPHVGGSAQAIIMKIVTDDARPVTELRKSVPPHVAAATTKALEKLAADRFETAKEFAAALTNPAFTLPTTQAAVVAGAAASGPWNPLSIAATALAALMTVVAMWGWMRPEPPRLVTRQEIVLGGFRQNLGAVRWGLAVAPDGSAIVYVDSVGTGSQLMLKQRDDVLSTPLSGTAGASGPFFSPDGAWIGFTADGKLRKVPRGGGGSVTLADSTMMLAVGFGAGAWLDNDTILYVDPAFNLRKVSAAGGPSTVVVQALQDIQMAVVDVWPLPQSRGALFTGCTLGCAESNVYVFDALRDTVRTLFEQAQGVWYTPTGHVVYADREGGAFAAPFDLDAMEVSGAAVPVLEGVRAPDLTFGADGTLIYVIGGALLGAYNTAELVWVDRNGAVTPVDPGWDFTLPAAPGVAVSPDGTRVALGIKQAGVDNIWIKQSDRTGGPLSRLTFGDDGGLVPRWTPDGASVLFTTLGESGSLVSKNADGTGTAEVLLDLEQPIAEGRWTPDGEWLLVRTGRGGPNVRDIWGLRPAVDSALVPLLTEEFDEISPTVSPDGKWLAYASNETGRFEVYVRPFPDTDGGRWQISTNGGREPVWAHSGRELFYLGPSEVIAAQVTTEPAFNRGEQRVLFSHGSEYIRGSGYTAYDVSPDDQRFVMIRRIISGLAQGQDSTRLMLVENWFEELKAKVGR